MNPVLVYLVDDDREILESLGHYLAKSGCEVHKFDSASGALRAIEDLEPEALITDLRMPDANGIELLKAVKEKFPLVPVTLVSAHGDVPMAVEAMQHGACSFLEKPFRPRRLLTIIQNSSNTNRLSLANQRLRNRLSELAKLDRVLLRESEEIKALRNEIIDLYDTDISVLISGETGTGKEVVAHALHDLSSRADGPFIAVNCAAISESLFESRMFSHVAGAFTGTTKSATGYFMAAKGGTIFLDEIGACPLEQQAKLLRVIENREITPVGSTVAASVDAHIVAATNEGLEQAVKENRFR